MAISDHLEVLPALLIKLPRQPRPARKPSQRICAATLTNVMLLASEGTSRDARTDVISIFRQLTR